MSSQETFLAGLGPSQCPAGGLSAKLRSDAVLEERRRRHRRQQQEQMAGQETTTRSFHPHHHEDDAPDDAHINSEGSSSHHLGVRDTSTISILAKQSMSPTVLIGRAACGELSSPSPQGIDASGAAATTVGNDQQPEIASQPSVIGVLPDGRHLVSLDGDGVVVGGKKIQHIDLSMLLDVPVDVAKQTVLDVDAYSKKKSREYWKKKDGSSTGSGNNKKGKDDAAHYTTLERPSTFLSTTTTTKRNETSTENEQIAPPGSQEPSRKTMIHTVETVVTTVTRSKAGEARPMGRVVVPSSDPLKELRVKRRLLSAKALIKRRPLSAMRSTTTPAEHNSVSNFSRASTPSAGYSVNTSTSFFTPASKVGGSSSAAGTVASRQKEQSSPPASRNRGARGATNVESSITASDEVGAVVQLGFSDSRSAKNGADNHSRHERPASAMSASGKTPLRGKPLSYPSESLVGDDSVGGVVATGTATSYLRRQFPCGFGFKNRRDELSKQYRSEHGAFQKFK